MYGETNLFVRHVAHLFEQFESGDDFLDVVTEAIEVVLDISQQDLLVVRRGAVQFLQRPLAGIEKHIAGSVFEWLVVKFERANLVLLVSNFLEHGLLGRFEQSVEAAQDHHGKDDITVFATDIHVAKAVVCDAPNEGNKGIVGGLVHSISSGLIFEIWVFSLSPGARQPLGMDLVVRFLSFAGAANVSVVFDPMVYLCASFLKLVVRPRRPSAFLDLGNTRSNLSKLVLAIPEGCFNLSFFLRREERDFELPQILN